MCRFLQNDYFEHVFGQATLKQEGRYFPLCEDMGKLLVSGFGVGLARERE